MEQRKRDIRGRGWCTAEQPTRSPRVARWTNHAGAVTSAVLALAMVSLVSAPASASDWPDADLRVIPMNFTTLPVIFSALGSNGGDIRGLTFSYDFDNDGVYDLNTEQAHAEHTYDTAGTYAATVQVTSAEFNLTSTAHVEFTVEDISEIGAPLSPSEGAPTIANARLSRDVVHAGESFTLTLDDLADGEEFGARLVSDSKSDPWFEDPTAVYGPFRGVSSAKLLVNDSVVPGKYKLLVLTNQGRMVELKISVIEPAATANDIGAFILGPGLYGGALFALVSAALVVWADSRRRRRNAL